MDILFEIKGEGELVPVLVNEDAKILVYKPKGFWSIEQALSFKKGFLLADIVREDGGFDAIAKEIEELEKEESETS